MAEVQVTVEELSDGRYVAYATFPTYGGVEDLLTAKDDCRSLHKVFEAAADTFFDSGYLSIEITQKRKETV